MDAKVDEITKALPSKIGPKEIIVQYRIKPTMPLRVSLTRQMRLNAVSMLVSIMTVVMNRNSTPIMVKLLEFSVKELSALSKAILVLGRKLL